MTSIEKMVFKDIYSKMASREKMVLKDIHSKMTRKQKNTDTKEPNTKYEWLAKNRRNPRRVETTNESTGEVKVFPSIYKACQYLETKATKLIQHDGYTFHANQKDIPCQYKIKILDAIANKVIPTVSE